MMCTGENRNICGVYKTNGKSRVVKIVQKLRTGENNRNRQLPGTPFFMKPGYQESFYEKKIREQYHGGKNEMRVL
jgi:hypothetical protein